MQLLIDMALIHSPPAARADDKPKWITASFFTHLKTAVKWALNENMTQRWFKHLRESSSSHGTVALWGIKARRNWKMIKIGYFKSKALDTCEIWLICKKSICIEQRKSIFIECSVSKLLSLPRNSSKLKRPLWAHFHSEAPGCKQLF